MVIRQSFTDLTLTLLTEQSKSRSGAAQIIAKQRDDYVVQYQYQNEPKMEFRDHSPIHSGGSTIEVGGSRPMQIEGEYWTARDTRGTYSLMRVSAKKATTLQEGRGMEGEDKEGV